MKKRTLFLVQSAIIASLYSAATILPFSLSFEAVQFRFAEALTILPFFTPAAIPGLTIGCIIANMWSRFGIVDIVFGSIATLLAALATYYFKRLKFGKFIAPLPPILFNAVIVGALIAYASTGNPFNIDIFRTMFIFNFLTVGFGELVICYCLGLPLLLALEKYKEKIFRT
jgi:uncharacterized membrane protein